MKKSFIILVFLLTAISMFGQETSKIGYVTKKPGYAVGYVDRYDKDGNFDYRMYSFIADDDNYAYGKSFGIIGGEIQKVYDTVVAIKKFADIHGKTSGISQTLGNINLSTVKPLMSMNICVEVGRNIHFFKIGEINSIKKKIEKFCKKENIKLKMEE